MSQANGMIAPSLCGHNDGHNCGHNCGHDTIPSVTFEFQSIVKLIVY